MIMRFCYPEIPKVYWVDCFTYKCNSCGNIYDVTLPNGNDNLAKFKEKSGDEERWLPIYGRGGYVDLLNKLVPENSHSITMEMTKMFLVELNKYCERGINGNGFDIYLSNFNCPSCNSNNTMYLSEKVLTNPKLSWLKISCHLIEDPYIRI